MKLLCLSVENFGVLHEFHIDLSDGLNVFCRENGAGKTTLAAFLCAMLYGLPASRKNDPAENDRAKYRPWQGGVFGGSITFSVRGKSYRAERRFGEGNTTRYDTFALYDLSDNSRSDDYSENLGYELFGIDAAAFERSIYLPQKLLSGERTNESITARLNRAIVGEGDDGAGLYKTAAAVLDRQRQYYAKQGGRGYIAALEETLASLHEKEYGAMQAKAESAAKCEEAQKLTEALSDLQAEKQALVAAQTAAVTREAAIAHGKSLYERRDAVLASAAQKRQFLHLDDEAGIAQGMYGEGAVRDAEEAVNAQLRITDRLDAAEDRITRIGEEQQYIAARFRDGIPGGETIETITSLVSMLGAAVSENVDDTPLPDCFSEEELSRHTEQAMMHSQMTEILARPEDARDAYRAACADAGMNEEDELPDDDTLQAYADVLSELSKNRERQAVLLPQKEQTDAAMEAFAHEHPNVPEQQEIVAMRSRFDALRSRTEEIEELEARQRLAVQVGETLRRSRRIRIGIGALLLLIAALLWVFYFVWGDIRFPIAGGVALLPGLLLLLLGIFTHPEESDEAMALEDAALKRLCTRKSEYEVEKDAIYAFLDRIGGDAEAVMDANEAVQRFDRAASEAREWEALCDRSRTLESQLQTLSVEEERLCAVLTSYTRCGGGDIADIGEDRAVFADYRRKITACRAAHAACASEREVRAQAQAKQNALSLALDRYLAGLNALCPQHAARCGDTENGTYTERMTAWCRTADLLRMQRGEQHRILEKRRAAEQSLASQLDAICIDTASEDMSVTDRAQAVLSDCARYQTLADERASLAEQRSALREQNAEVQTALTAFLSGYFGGGDSQGLPDPVEGLQIIRARASALAEDMERLRDAQRQLAAFLSEHAMTEADLTGSHVADAPSADDTADALRVLEDRQQQLTTERARLLQEAELASQIADTRSAIREQLAKTEETLSAAKDALAVIRQTQQMLDDARTAMSTRYLGYMETRFREYWSRMSGTDAADAEKLSLDASFAVQTEVFGERRDAAYFSRGTQDCIEFCVRLALIDAMFTDGGKKTDAPHPPILLDDPFVNLDQAHLTAASRLLHEISDRFQILYFVCHESRA